MGWIHTKRDETRTGDETWAGRTLKNTRLLPLVLLLALLAGATQQVALAHALLVRSEPEANAEIANAPEAIEMWFSEPLESSFSHARLLDASGAEVTGVGPSVVDSTDPTHMRLPIADLSPGIYTVVWTTLSSVDGHEWIGSFPVTLLNPDGSRPTGAALTVTAERGELPEPVEAAARWLSLLGAILLLGALVFRHWVAHPRAARVESDDLPHTVERVWRWLAAVALIAIFVGGWLKIGSQVAALGASDRLLDLLINTRPGRLILLRQLLLIPAVALLAMPRPVRGQGTRLWAGVEMLVALAMLATFPFASHAAAVPGRGWAILGDFVHLLGAAVWMGGLIFLALLLQQTRSTDESTRNVLGRMVRAYSLLAAGAVFVLTVTGLFSSLVQLPSLESLWTSTYGLVLLGKLGLVGLALGLAFLNNRAVHRRGDSGSVRFARRVGVEALISLGLLATVALLVQTPPPPRPQAAAGPALPFNDIQVADDLLIHLQVSPNQAGSNGFWTHLYHSDGSPIGEVQLVRLFFAPEQAELGQARTDLPETEPDIFEDEGAWLGQSGAWEVTVYVRRRGMDDATAVFQVEVPPPPGVVALGVPWENPAAALPPETPIGLFLLAIGLVPLLWWGRLRGRPWATGVAVTGAVCLLVGFALGGRGLLAGQASTGSVSAVPENLAAVSAGIEPGLQADAGVSPVSTSSPLPTGTPQVAATRDLSSLLPTPTLGPPTPTPTPDALFLAGAELYRTHCIACHGPHGMGDGPAAGGLTVQPAILPIHVPQHRDEDLYVLVSDGFPNLGMPSFGEILTQDEILQVLRYLRVRFGAVVP